MYRGEMVETGEVLESKDIFEGEVLVVNDWKYLGRLGSKLTQGRWWRGRRCWQNSSMLLISISSLDW